MVRGKNNKEKHSKLISIKVYNALMYKMDKYKVHNNSLCCS